MFFNDLVQINGDVDLDLMKVIHQSVLNQCDGFYVEYQPVVHAQTGEIVGAEALVAGKRSHMVLCHRECLLTGWKAIHVCMIWEILF